MGAFLIRREKNPKYSKSQASIQTAPFKGVASFYIARGVFSFGRNSFGSRTRCQLLIPRCFLRGSVSAPQPPRSLQDPGCCEMTAEGQSTPLQCRTITAPLPPSHPAWIPVHPVLWLIILEKSIISLDKLLFRESLPPWVSLQLAASSPFQPLLLPAQTHPFPSPPTPQAKGSEQVRTA